MTLKECYQILKVEQSASLEDVKRAYRRRAFELHPDLNPDVKDASRQFQLLNEAYVVLTRLATARENAARENTARPQQETRTAGPRWYDWGFSFGGKKEEDTEERRSERDEVYRDQAKQQDADRQAQEKKEQERKEQARQEKERTERIERERQERDRFDREQVERERQENARQEREQHERDRHERERYEREHLERERQEKERQERERIERERLEQERRKNPPPRPGKTAQAGSSSTTTTTTTTTTTSSPASGASYGESQRPRPQGAARQNDATRPQGAARSEGAARQNDTARPQGAAQRNVAPGSGPADSLYAEQQEVLRDILNDDFARRVFEDIYSEIRKKGPAPTHESIRPEPSQATQASQAKQTNQANKANQAGQQQAQKVAPATKPWDGFSLNLDQFKLDFSGGVGNTVKSWLRGQIDEEQTIRLPATGLFPGARVRLQIRRGFSDEVTTLEVTLPPDFAVGKPIRLKGMGKKLGSVQGDFYLTVVTK